jgi:phosphatidylserine/phosphatidylglycerophosphate/cardiolipin synthase-like enzyme
MVIPLIAFSTANNSTNRIPQIMAHMANLIVRADKEVFLATNYWINSVASSYITEAMKELSRRAGKRGTKIIMKMIYDRGSPKQMVEPHYFVGQKEYSSKAVNLPPAEDIPNIDIQVMNFHRPMLGTFHCKYMIVDRKYAVLQSNNIQDNDNVEMMIHMEGPIVDSMYDMALISWDKKLEPPLPSLNTPAVEGGLGSFADKSHDEIFGPDGSLKGHSAIVHPDKMQERKVYEHEHREIKQPGSVPPEASNDTSNTGRADVLTGPSTTDSVLHPADNAEAGDTGVRGITKGIGQQNLNDNTNTQKQTSKQMVAENARLEGTASESFASNEQKTQPAPKEARPPGTDAITQEYLNSGEQAIPASQIQHPSPDGNLLPEHTPDDPHYDIDIAGEVARVQTSVSPKSGETRVEAVTRHLNHTTNKGFQGTAPDCAPNEEMTPYIPHPVHEPFPMAMVCREPYGPPNHHSVYNPQNEVWLSALRYAQKNVFIQTPTLNAEPLVPAIQQACERGIDVFCYICLGYNDTVSTKVLLMLTLQWHSGIWPLLSVSYYHKCPRLTPNIRASCSRCKAAPTR